jgi:hypothetical protein
MTSTTEDPTLADASNKELLAAVRRRLPVLRGLSDVDLLLELDRLSRLRASEHQVCPWWCTADPAAHLQWDHLLGARDDGMTEERYHVRDIDDHVTLVQIERRNNEGTKRTGETAVWVADMEDEHLTGMQAREHAANVLAAADLLDRVVAGR